MLFVLLLQADTDFYVFSELLKDYICLIQAVKVSCSHVYLKADLDGTTLTYDCRMQLAQVLTCVRLSQGFETCFKILQLFSSCMRQSWGSCEVDLREAIRVVWMT